MPTVSVIIPNYNHAAYLKQRIDSVIDQTFQDFEVIILDDCSKDDSKNIIEQYRNHPKVSHIVYNEENSGSTFKQWKKGVELAKGEWIWIAESDDWAELTFLDYLTKPFLQSKIKDVCLIYGQSYIYYNETSEIFTEEFRRKFEIIDKNSFIEQKLIPRNYLYNASMAIFRKEAFLKISDYYTKFSYCGDWIFWAEISRIGKSIQIPQYINYFRKHPKSVSLNAMKNYKGIMQDLDAILYFRDFLKVDNKQITLGAYKFLKRYVEISTSNFKAENIKEIEDKFINILGKESFYRKKRQLFKTINYPKSLEYRIKLKIRKILKKIN
ncbi:glycosyltransferase family 2 protein [Epilithonimonas hominis]|uniref:Glycosyl transferase family 2 n=1 Tax=Epilithonimonas hominis TaxID=420404 RepID=A0A1H6IN76_9FLAO|nr:glycosyltransferase family 2 protein [Epilithonimonas hominis]SEH47736.1 Glycosyl transferase family 2 [Epilithonimonas hominis]